MRKVLNKFKISLTISLIGLILSGCASNNTSSTSQSKKELEGKTIILHTNDVHGAIEGYSYLPYLKKTYEDKGAKVYLVDGGDFLNGNIYVSISKGESAITLMNQVKYDVVTFGNHEFDYGVEILKQDLQRAEFKVICSNVKKDGSYLYDVDTVINNDGLKIGFFALLTPETQTKVNPAYIKGLDFTEGDELYSCAQNEINKLKNQADIVICLSHLGVADESIPNRSIDMYNKVSGLDFIIDGHSHTVMSEGPNHEPIQSTGTEFQNIGKIVIDNLTKRIESHELVPCEGLAQDSLVLATAKNIKDTVDAEYNKKFAESKVLLNGEQPDIRNCETNLGDLVCDAMHWSIMNQTELQVQSDHVVCLNNGGGIRASIQIGDITRTMVHNVLPFGNTTAVNYVTGSELLEVLEASTFATPETAGAFPQISGMNIQIDTTKQYDQGEKYPNSTYYAPASIKRISILDVNGKAFNKDDTYAVITNDFCASGGDTYYAFKRARDEGHAFDTSIPTDESLVNYIKFQLGGIVDESYATPKGRISIIK